MPYDGFQMSVNRALQKDIREAVPENYKRQLAKLRLENKMTADSDDLVEI